MKRLHRGFNLVEVAVALVVLSLVLTASMQLITRASENNDRTGAAGGGIAASDDGGRFNAASIDAALLGFLRANHRLPCPDITGDGLENCTQGGQPVSVGYLPLASLQLSYPPEERWRLPIDYGVYRGLSSASDLAQSGAGRFTRIPRRGSASPPQPFAEIGAPACGLSTSNAACDVPDRNFIPSPVNLVGTDSVTLNVLDTCQALINARSEAQTLRTNRLHSGLSDADPARTNVAYAFAWSTTARLLAGNDLLESRQGANALRFFPAGFSPEGSDDLTQVRSFLELAQAFDCSSRLGDADLTLNTAATLMTSELLNRTRLAHMKIFHEDAKSEVKAQRRAVLLGGVDVLLAGAGLKYAIAEGTQGNPVAAVQIAVSILELANTVAGVVLTVIALVDAENFESEVGVVVSDSRVRLNANGNRMIRAQDVAELVQQRGQL